MKYDEKDYAYIEEITEKRFKSLERSVVCDSPRTTLEPARRSGGGRIALKILSGAAVVALFFGMYLGIRYVSERGGISAGVDTGPSNGTAANDPDFPYEKPAVTKNEAEEMDALLNEICRAVYTSQDPDLKTSHADLLKRAAAWGVKIIEPAVKKLEENRASDGPGTQDIRRLDTALADIVRMIIDGNGETGFYDDMKQRYADAIPEGATYEQLYSLLGLSELAGQINEAMDLVGVNEEAKYLNATKIERSEFVWELTTADNGVVRIYPRRIFGDKYPVCLYFYDVVNGIRENETTPVVTTDNANTDDEAEREFLLDIIPDLCVQISAGSQTESVLETARTLKLPDLRAFYAELSTVQNAKRELKSLVKKYALIANNYERPEQTDASNEKKDLLEHVKRICDWHGVNYTAVLQTAEPLGEEDLSAFIDGLEPVIDDKAALKSYLKEWSKKAQ